MALRQTAFKILNGKVWGQSLKCQQVVGRLHHGMQQRFIQTSLTNLDKFEVINIQDEKHFEEHVTQSKTPVVLDFHATWCGPCKLLAPRLEKVLSNHANPVNLVKVDVDKFEDLAIKYRVQGVPAIFAIKDGRVVDKFVGLKEEDIIEGFVEKLTS
ncbi:TXN2 [Bugula neritina]|uniref:TXN2 n=1 Tax=Bugula neritina TaxID=10212 RepID=A0A7J7IVZ0_BUGNE|nr:TXN2 [Bugula neritina]